MLNPLKDVFTVAGLRALIAKIKGVLSTKVDKVSGATSGNLAGLDGNGDLTDSGKKPSDFATAAQGAKADTAIQGVKVNGTELTPDANNKVDVSALPASTKYAANIALSVNPTTFVCTVQLKDQDGNNIGSSSSIDLPLESVVVSGRYDDTTKKVILALQNGSTVEFSVADLVSGLLSEDGDGKDVTVTFTQASTRANIGTGESLATMFGKIKKWLSDLGTAAFKDAGAANGVASLDSNGDVPVSQLPTASTSAIGIMQLTNTVDSSTTDKAVTPKGVYDYVQTSEFVIVPESGKKFFTIAKLAKADIPKRASLTLTLAPAATDADTGFTEPQSADIDITCMAQGVSSSYDKYDVTIRWYYPGTALYTWNSYPTDGMKELYLIESGNYIYVVLETAIDTLDQHTTKILCHTDNRAFVFIGTQGASIPSGTVKAGAVFQSYIDSLFMHKAPQKIVYVPANTDFYEFIMSSYSNSFSKLVFGNDGLPANTAFCADVELIFLDLTCDAYIKMGSLGQSVTCHISYDGIYGFVMFYGNASRLVIMMLGSSGLSVLPNNDGYAPMYMPSTSSITSGDTTHVPTANAVSDFVGTGSFPNTTVGIANNMPFGYVILADTPSSGDAPANAGILCEIVPGLTGSSGYFAELDVFIVQINRVYARCKVRMFVRADSGDVSCRSWVIWEKPNPTSISVTVRRSTTTKKLFLCAKGASGIYAGCYAVLRSASDMFAEVSKSLPDWVKMYPNAALQNIDYLINDTTESNQVGSSSQPVYVDADGSVKACTWANVVGSVGSESNTLYYS